MILSYHPIIKMDKNLICAGRLPDAGDLAAIRRAEAVIVSQGCSEPLYRMAKTHCAHVFPNLDVRFDFPGKLGQIKLFRRLSIAHPPTVIFDRLAQYHESLIPFKLPWVIKRNWGGQGEGVWLAETAQDVNCIFARLQTWEKTGQSGFLIQQRIDTGRRSLRVAVIGDRIISYWRVRSQDQPFGIGVTHGACIEFDSDPALQERAKQLTRQICRKTWIQLAGFDFVFDLLDLQRGKMEPLILEINHFFGRTGLGGSNQFYKILKGAVHAWLAAIDMERKPQ